ncbi:hypothetical protein CON64_21315 [Bacillus pseudomycoides]|nr:hypothetical protein CON64_21315 [Bacillus pseudomycoides]
MKAENPYLVEWVWVAKHFALVVPFGNPLPQKSVRILDGGSSIRKANDFPNEEHTIIMVNGFNLKTGV